MYIFTEYDYCLRYFILSSVLTIATIEVCHNFSRDFSYWRWQKTPKIFSLSKEKKNELINFHFRIKAAAEKFPPPVASEY